MLSFPQTNTYKRVIPSDIARTENDIVFLVKLYRSLLKSLSHSSVVANVRGSATSPDHSETLTCVRRWPVDVGKTINIHSYNLYGRTPL